MSETGITRVQEHVATKMPSDDEIFHHHRRSWTEWQCITGVSKDALRRHFLKHGWRRGRSGACRMTHGPCASCGERRSMDEFDHRRHCGRCQEEERKNSLYRREFDRWLERHPEFMPRLQRQGHEGGSPWAMAS